MAISRKGGVLICMSMALSSGAGCANPRGAPLPTSAALPPLPPPDPPVRADPFVVREPSAAVGEFLEPPPLREADTAPDEEAMRATMDAVDLEPCSIPALPGLLVHVDITFARSGEVRSVRVDEHEVGRVIARCIEGRLAAAHVEPFGGRAVTIHRLFRLP